MDKKINYENIAIVAVVVMYLTILFCWSLCGYMNDQINTLKARNEAIRREYITEKGQLEDVIYTYEGLECGNQ
jgi:hypothetical protein